MNTNTIDDQLTNTVRDLARFLDRAIEVRTLALGASSVEAFAEACPDADYDALIDHGADLPETVWDNTHAEDIVEAIDNMLYDAMPLELCFEARRTVGRDWQPVATIVVYGTGGPHIELRTDRGVVTGVWGSTRREWHVTQEVCDFYNAAEAF